ncbi:HAD family hydrolase [Thermotoga profunda]|uniref:HAD family hydrolase n=1 Tax=Thermotoga profunda TaxID=1508420 RepID=UPI002FC95D29
MWVKALLLDYDGTLALVDENEFTQKYFQKLKNFVYENYSLTISSKDILECVEHITKVADGKKNNYERFLSCFSKKYDFSADWKNIFDEFYQSEFFDSLKVLIKPNLRALELLKEFKQSGHKVVLATNPVFPKIAVIKRMSWIDLGESDFDLITHMENFHFCKPDPRYFLQICSIIDVKPSECLMIGNDDLFDRSCEKVGMKYLSVEKIITGGELDGSNLVE